MNRHHKLGVVSAALVGLACFGIADVETHQHGCTEHHNSAWNDADLLLDHSDSRACELDHTADDPVSTAGTVYDLSADYGASPPYNDAVWADLKVWDAYVVSSFTGLGTPLGQDFEFFFWGSPAPGSSQTYDWQAQMYVDYLAGGSPDHGEFVVTLNSVCCFDDPTAVVTVDHNPGEEG